MVLNTLGCSLVCSASTSTSRLAKGTRIFSNMSTTSMALQAARPLSRSALGLKPPFESISIFEDSLKESNACPVFQMVVVFMKKNINVKHETVETLNYYLLPSHFRFLN